MAKSIRVLRPIDQPDPEPKTDIEFALWSLRRDVSFLQSEVNLWKERCRYKNEMLQDEVDWLTEKLETNEPDGEASIRRRISRLLGAVHKFEPGKS